MKSKDCPAKLCIAFKRRMDEAWAYHQPHIPTKFEKRVILGYNEPVLLLIVLVNKLGSKNEII